MGVDDLDLQLFFGGACTAIVAGAALLRASRNSAGWIVLLAGLGAVTLLALAQLTGRLGPEHLWFGEPTFYLSVLILLGASTWWLTRPATRVLRFGLPAALLALLSVAVVLARHDGRSTPLSMLMPTGDQPAPDFGYVDDSGRLRNLSDLEGKVVLLNFWATWCAPCRREMPLLSSMQREHAEDGFVVLYVSLEDREVLARFLATHRFDGIHGRIERAPDFYSAGKYYPLSYLISRDGRVTRRWSGRPKESWLRAQVADALQAG